MIEATFYASSGTTIMQSDIPEYMLSKMLHCTPCSEDTTGLSLSQMVERYEARVISETYGRNQKNLTKTAADLQLTKQGLAYKLKKYQIK